MTRFQKLAATTVAGTLLLVTLGVVVRATDSGLGCPDWPFCYGQVLPSLGDAKAWIEWLHRTVAAVLGLLILAQAVVAFVDHRDRRSLLWPSIGAVLLVAFQAYLGRQTVLLGNTGESVTAHLATSQALLGAAHLHPGPVVLPGPDRRPRVEPAVHPARRVRGRGDLRPAPVRGPGDGGGRRPDLPRLAAHGRHVLPAADRR